MTVKIASSGSREPRDCQTRRSSRWTPAGLVGAVLIGLAAGSGRAGAEEPAIDLSEAVVLRPAAGGGRSPIHVDPIEARIVQGRWEPPAAGDIVAGSGDTQRRWESIRVGADGGFQHPALRGGYADVEAESDRDRIMVLEATGHDLVYVNGEPRVGDPYSNGSCHLPVRLDAGTNHLLFHVGRGSFRARLVPPRAAAQIDTADATLPDLITGQESKTWGAVVVLNARDATAEGLSIRVTAAGGPESITIIPPIPPLATRKVAFRIEGPAPTAPGEARLKLRLVAAEEDLDTATLNASISRPEQAQKRTFRSGIDGSIQYFAVVPATSQGGPRPGLILTLHGAAVEAIGQARCYPPRGWAHIVAPTNRRPFGFDWEDWGRLDALEVLETARAQLDPDPSHIYLTGHSMGGHGTWQIGLSFPGTFAALAPSAGWVSMWSYAGARRIEDDSPVASLLRRASRPSDTLALAENARGLGVYVLHGDADDNVPVGQARTMRKVLGEFHPDFSYYERPGAGHWWGNECMDWPPLMEFLQRHELKKPEDIARVDFVTINPGISSRRAWVAIEDQLKRLEPSAVHLTYDRQSRRFAGSTANVARLRLDLGHVPKGEAIKVELDGQSVAGLDDATGGGGMLWLGRTGDDWAVIQRPVPSRKGPHRFGPFREAFRHRFLFVYGTRGNSLENARALAKARFDAETFWYRGNGSVDIVPDSAFDPDSDRDRDVILIGNAETNAAWPALLGNSPVQVHRDRVRIGDRTINGDDLACLVLRPRPGSDSACVAAVAGTGVVGLRLTERLPYFISGVGYPDCLVLGAEVLEKGIGGVRAAGYFGPDWGVSSGEFAWRD